MSDRDPDPSEAPSSSPPVAGTGSPAILETLRYGPMSGSALAKRLGMRKAMALAALSTLVEAKAVIREGENRETRFRLATPEDKATAPARVSDDPYSQERIDAMVRAAFKREMDKWPPRRRELFNSTSWGTW